MNERLIWLLAGLVPYYGKWLRIVGGGWTLEIRALFWTFRIEEWAGGLGGWTLRVPLINRMKEAVGAAVMRLRSDEPLDGPEDNTDQQLEEMKEE